DTMDQMLWIGETTATLDRTFCLEDVMREVRKVSAEDIRIVGRMLFKTERVNFAMIGPWKNKEQSVKAWCRLK
ncbi:MAG: hypothetical protein PHE65_07770, partial [Candidatus Omnitrophica bacterium]|nr:hypothetical protein [Candidatus Omnitrophota bacterium]